MEIRAFAEQILLAETIEQKLAPLEGDATDLSAGVAWRAEAPARPANLVFAARREAPQMPRPGALHDASRRAVAHHIMANHELQACEVMAFVLCAFPEAPAEFRRGMVNIIADEQRHTRLHMKRARALGIEFGDLPVNCYIWKKALLFENLLDYLAGLPLMFEGRNLDHSLEFERDFQQAGDESSAQIMRVIHNDEIEHVAFGLRWLRKLKPADQSDWDAFAEHLHWPLRPSKARGDEFYREPRRAAGMTDEFIDRLEQFDAD